jgi:hypothetical protein
VHRFLTAIGRDRGGERQRALTSRSRSVLYGRRGGRRAVALVLTLLAASAQAACATTDTAANCAKTPANSQPREPRTGPTGGPGSAPQSGHQAPPPKFSPSPSPPTPVNGQLSLTAANTGQTIAVPADTMIDVRLEPDSGVSWTVPETSDPHALPRLSASDPCDTVKEATFRAVQGNAMISATRPNGDAKAQLRVTIRVTR